MTEPRLILASTSRYRREMLSRFGLPFDAVAPGVDETPLDGEAPLHLVQRLAAAKAAAVARAYPDACVIGSDQLAEFDGRVLGKPGTPERAIEQLRAMSGREVTFLTALCVMRGEHEVGVAVDRTVVRFRTLSQAEVERYVEAEQPLDCAGSFKSEGRGITLFDAIETVDPTALIGLPLIATARLLRDAGFVLP
ncbi:Maf-like protein [Lysobacter xinjiangensis]|uniref:7-methyl-GTP pyrophosphatase n=1 Tax=Cognatilysobacter xinjiangensis TaxID=546892 RepID=A0ABQ3BYM7_9GAMM|nr:Maf family nucleotide pyrophosphatase [Lysobacter xinjiangensis]GGZ61608.1 Maf-like protein [Lysobacter xinjiangensis]